MMSYSRDLVQLVCDLRDAKQNGVDIYIRMELKFVETYLFQQSVQ